MEVWKSLEIFEEVRMGVEKLGKMKGGLEV